MFKNDERYWDINLLNKWFAISSIVFLLSMVWTFIDDNDDEFKEYQREFRKLEIAITENNLKLEQQVIEGKTEDLDIALEKAQSDYDTNSELVKSINDKLGKLRAGFYKINLKYAEQKAKMDVLKFELESENIKGAEKSLEMRQVFDERMAEFNETKLEKEDFEQKIALNEKQIKNLKLLTKEVKDERDKILKKVNLAENKLALLDRSKMSFMNKIGDIVRDLPILDFMDPYYKVKQTVVKDVLYDVNFVAMPAVDRCTSCHLGIANPNFVDAEQPYTTHPDLDLYLTSKSPHPEEAFGCTSCHSGRSRGTSFLSSAHTPNSPEQKKEWKEKYHWKPVKHWLQPMLQVDILKLVVLSATKTPAILLVQKKSTLD